MARTRFQTGRGGGTRPPDHPPGGAPAAPDRTLRIVDTKAALEAAVEVRKAEVERIKTKEAAEKRRAQAHADMLAAQARVQDNFRYDIAGVPNSADADAPREVHFNLKASSGTDVDLAAFLPELRGMRLLVGEEKLRRMETEEIDAETHERVVRVPEALLVEGDGTSAADTGKLLLFIEQAVALDTPETKAQVAAEKKLSGAIAGMFKKRPLVRVREYKAMEEAVVRARAEKAEMVEELVEEVVKEIKEKEHIDLFAPFGGEEGWKKQYRERLEAEYKASEYLFAPKELKQEEHGHDEGHAEEGHGHGHGHGGSKGVFGVFKDAAKETKNIFVTLDNDLTIRVAAIDAHFAKEEKEIHHRLKTIKEEEKHDKEHRTTVPFFSKEMLKRLGTDAKRFVKKSGVTAELGWEETKRLTYKYPGTAVKSLSYVGGLAAVPTISLGMGIWGLTNLPGLKGAKEEVANWINWGMGLVGLPWEIPTGKKKGGGGHDHH